MQKQKERARNAAAVENSDWVELQAGEQQFVGYDYTEYNCHILRYRKVTQKKNEFYELVLDATPFYGEMGGQVGDCGVLVNENETIEIIDTKRENNQSVHIVKQLPKDPAAEFMACVDTDKRNASAANHTATHLLDYALKQILGDHVEQKGSFVSPDTLRFDFSHFEKVSDEQLREVERMVNDMIRQDIHIDEHRDVPLSPCLVRSMVTRYVLYVSVLLVSSVVVSTPHQQVASVSSRFSLRAAWPQVFAVSRQRPARSVRNCCI